ncbi:MAG TPA: Lpg1974 family pore-forming outer membrane protein [Rhizomicrobium sp.]|nr:Lpg1974 family pore-forming outer membrane protein [Rhizomicrobium sp.]
MTDLMQPRVSSKQLRYRLLATVSSMAFVVCGEIAHARDDNDGRPSFWIEIGGAFDQLASDSDVWLAPNTPSPQANPTPPFGILPKVGYDLDLKVIAEPHDSDWSFSIALVYGRSLRGRKTNHDQTYNTKIGLDESPPKYVYTNWNFANTQQRSTSNHLILDFQAGKDVGIGIFGGKSTLNVGIRWAKLNDDASGHLSGATNAIATFPLVPYATETKVDADFAAKHSFNGIGPSISWESQMPIAGSRSDGFSVDWGINAALLFGKQKTRTNLHMHSSYCATFIGGCTPGAGSTQSLQRSKTVIVPNLGGFAGISWRMPNAKVSVGYKADFFFNAIDVGINTRGTATRGFYGPFATVSIGLGG